MLKNYHDLMENILDSGDKISDERTGVGTTSLFGEKLSWNLQNGFPAITTKKLAWKGVVSELLWFLRGSSNVHELREILHGKENRTNLEKTTIWDANYNHQAVSLGYENGEMGDIYGTQWRDFGRCVASIENCENDWLSTKVKGVDQIKLVLNEAEKNPGSRRLIVSAWNPQVVWNINHDENVDFKEATLPPCHVLFQLRITNGRLDMLWFQRSVDVFLGLSFNIASYALLLHMFARILNLNVGRLSGLYGDVHIYNNHISQVEEQLRREHYDAPELWINPELKTLEDFENASVNDFKLINYKHHSAIKADMAV